MIDQLQTIVDDVDHLARTNLEDLTLAQHIGGLHYATKLRQTAAALEADLSNAICEHRDAGATPNQAGWVAEVRRASNRKEWRQDELRDTARNVLLTAVEDQGLTVEQVVDLMWDLQPLNGSMRLTPLRTVWDIEPDDFCTVTPRKVAQVIDRPAA